MLSSLLPRGDSVRLRDPADLRGKEDFRLVVAQDVIGLGVGEVLEFVGFFLPSLAPTALMWIRSR